MVNLTKFSFLAPKEPLKNKFKSQFHNVKADRFTVTKQKAGSESEIEAISGATITSKAVTNGVNAGISYVKNILAKGGK